MIKTITIREISKIIGKPPSTLYRWKKAKPGLYEAVYLGCMEMKYGPK